MVKHQQILNALKRNNNKPMNCWDILEDIMLYSQKNKYKNKKGGEKQIRNEISSTCINMTNNNILGRQKQGNNFHYYKKIFNNNKQNNENIKLKNIIKEKDNIIEEKDNEIEKLKRKLSKIRNKYNKLLKIHLNDDEQNYINTFLLKSKLKIEIVVYIIYILKQL